MTDYSQQTIDDIEEDLLAWVEALEETRQTISSEYSALLASGYWDKVPFNVKSLFGYATKFYDSSAKDIGGILAHIRSEVAQSHVALLERMASTAVQLNIRFGLVWHRDYDKKKYGDPDFAKVERIYAVGRDMAVDLIDIGNASNRLSDYIGKRAIRQNANNDDPAVPQVASAATIVSASGSSSDKVDFGIITIRDDEYAAILRRFPAERFQSGKNRTYARASTPIQTGGAYSVAMARAVEPGTKSAQDLARDMVEDLDPQWILLVGIGGGVPSEEYTLGDVILARRLHDFSVGSQIEGADRQTTDQGGPLARRVTDLLAQLPALSAQLGDWNTESAILCERPPISLKPSQFYGPADVRKLVKKRLSAHFAEGVAARAPLATDRAFVVTGDLIKHTGALDDWNRYARDVALVEMELNGVEQAANRKDHQYPVLAVRGVSDVIGFKRDVKWTAYAANVAAAFVYALLNCQLVHEIVSPRRQAKT
jgi:nucleoside phosphorylase